LWACLFLLGILLFGGKSARAAGTEQIDSFDAVIRLNADASAYITETIQYDFGSGQKHGIYRNIPVRYEARGGNYNLRLSGIAVTDERGVPYEYEASDSGENRVLKIGNADTLVGGKKTYVIRYTVRRAINYFADHDEFYWNVTGNGWKVPVQRSSAHVIFPQAVQSAAAQIKCFAGAYGAATPCAGAAYFPEDSQNAAGADFTSQALAAGQSLTIVTGLPKGVLHQPDFWENLLATAWDNWVLSLPFLVFLVMYDLWRKKGRDPKGRGTIIPEYDVPDQLTPAEAGTIVDESCGQKEIVAEIINLAVLGYLKIRREEKKVLLIKTDDYIFEKLKDSADLSSPYQQELMEGIFKQGSTAKFSELKKDFYPRYQAAVKDVFVQVSNKGYFSKNPQNIAGIYIGISFLSLFLLFMLLLVIGYNIGPFTALAFFFSAVIALLFSLVMPQKTEKGVLTKEHILGLKEYLTVAEKDRLEFHNAPAKDPQQFEKLLPYAIALGVEKEWAKQFEGIYTTPPSWYDDPQGIRGFNAMYLASSLGGFRTDFASAAMPPSASSGGSGFGGGGFSGGGFGGGGGGSW
jgi:uncharacterized membrane protein